MQPADGVVASRKAEVDCGCLLVVTSLRLKYYYDILMVEVHPAYIPATVSLGVEARAVSIV